MSRGISVSLPQYEIRAIAAYRPTLIIPAILPIVTADYLCFNITIWRASYWLFWATADVVINVALFISERLGCTAGSILAMGILSYAAFFSAMGFLDSVGLGSEKLLRAPLAFWPWRRVELAGLGYPMPPLQSVPPV